MIATLFKEQGLLSPLVVLLYAKLGSKQWSNRDLLSYVAGSLLWTIVYLVLRNYAIQGYDPPFAGLPLAGYDFFQRSAIMATALVKHLLLFCFPTEPLLDYDHLLLTAPTSFFAFMPWLGVGIALAGLAILVVGYLKGHLYAVMGVALVAIGLGPVSNVFLPIGTLIAERFLYLPSAGLCLLIAGCLGRRLGSRAVAALITSVLFCMVALCWRHIYYYSDPLRLASRMALHHADKPRLQHLAALTFEKFGKLEEAEQAWEQQRRLEPDNPMIDIYLTRLNIRNLMAVRRGQQSGSQSDLMNELRENLEHLKNLNDLGDAPLLRGTIYYLLEDYDQASIEYLNTVFNGIRSQSAKQEAARALLEMEKLNLGSTRLNASLWQEITRISQGQDTDSHGLGTRIGTDE